jgi:hypothetical protein
MVDAASEDAALNVQILKSLSEIVCDDAILASNTSSIPIAQLATVLCAIAVSLLPLAIPMSGSPLSVPPGCERPVPVRVARAPDDEQERSSRLLLRDE